MWQFMARPKNKKYKKGKVVEIVACYMQQFIIHKGVSKCKNNDLDFQSPFQKYYFNFKYSKQSILLAIFTI